MGPPSPALALYAVLTRPPHWPSESSWRLPELHGSPQRKQQHDASPGEKAPGWALGVGQSPWRSEGHPAGEEVLVLGNLDALNPWVYLEKQRRP